MTDIYLRESLAARIKTRINSMPYVLLLVTTITWAGHVVIAKGIAGSIPPVSLAFWRSFFACLILLPLGWPRLRRDWPVIRRSLPILILISAPAVALFNTFLYLAVQTTTAINVSLISTTMPAVIIILSRLILRHRIGSHQVAGLLLSFTGALLVIVRGDWHTLAGLVFVRGDLWMVAAVSSTALYSVLLHYRPPIHALSLTLMMFIIGVLLLLPPYLWEWFRGAGFEVTPAVAASIAYIALFPSVIAYFCWNRGIQLVGASRAGLLMHFVPVFVAILAYLFLGEVLHWYHPVGLVLILAGVFMFNRRRMAESAPGDSGA